MEQSVEWQSWVYICFVDSGKASDCVNRDVLFKPPLCPEKITNLAKKFYQGVHAQIQQLTESFDMLTGVRKGCLLSPHLFLVVLD